MSLLLCFLRKIYYHSLRQTAFEWLGAACTLGDILHFVDSPTPAALLWHPPAILCSSPLLHCMPGSPCCAALVPPGSQLWACSVLRDMLLHPTSCRSREKEPRDPSNRRAMGGVAAGLGVWELQVNPLWEPHWLLGCQLGSPGLQ